MILETTRNGELGKLSENLALVRAMSATELGFPEGTPMPDTVNFNPQKYYKKYFSDSNGPNQQATAQDAQPLFAIEEISTAASCVGTGRPTFAVVVQQ